MPKKPTNAELAAELTILKHQMAELQGPVHETLERVKQALVGTEDGQHEGLLTRMIVVERDYAAVQKFIEETAATFKLGDGRLDKLEAREQSHFNEIKGLKSVNKTRKYWVVLIVGAILTGAVSLGWSWIEKKIWPDNKPPTEHSQP